MMRYLSLVIMLTFLSTLVVKAQTCTVNAGVNFVMCQDEGTSWTLFGNTNDPGGNPVPITWSVISEPAGSNVSITSTSSETTEVTNVTELGEYVFQIEGVCPDGSGTPMDLVTYRLDEPIPDPGLDPSYVICGSGTISIPNPLPDVSYGWLGIDFDDSYENGVRITGSETSVEVSVSRYYPGGDGHLVLFSTRGGCIRRDTVDLLVQNLEVADAGEDVYICGDSWSKRPWVEEHLEASEYRYLTYGGIMTWNQLSGPSTVTPSYNPTYYNYNDGWVHWDNLVPGTYEYELVFEYPECNLTTRDTVLITATTGVPDDCQNFSGSRYFIGDCEGDLDEWVIDLKDYGIDPALILPGDSIKWSIDGDECTFPVPEVNQMVVVVPTAGICSDCDLYATYICNSSPGCGTGIKFEFFNHDVQCDVNDVYRCTDDGLPIATNVNLPSSAGCIEDCSSNYAQTWFEVVSSSQFNPGDKFSGTIGSFPFEIGTHKFTYHKTYYNYYAALSQGDLLGSYGCEEVYPFAIVIAGDARDANAGTDAILPCGQTTTTLSGSDPDLPTTTGATSLWTFVDGPVVPTMSDPTLLDLNVSNMVSGVYTFKYTVGSAACGFYEDEVTIYVATAPPATPNAGVDDTICYGGEYFLSADAIDDGSGSWSVSPSAGVVFADPSNPNTSVTGLSASTNYTFTWTSTNGCGTASDNVTITTTATQTDFADAGPDQCIKATNSADWETFLSANTPTVPGAVGTWTIVYRNPDSDVAFTIADPNDPNSYIDAFFSNSNALLEWAVTSPGCETQRDTVALTFTYPSSTPQDKLIEVCDGVGPADIYYLDPNATTFGNFLRHWYWSTEYDGPSGVSFLSDTTQNVLTVNFPQTGEYVFYVENGVACDERASIVVYVNESAPFASAGTDQYLCDQYSFQLKAQAAQYGGYWSASQVTHLASLDDVTFSDIQNPDATVSVPTSGAYEFVWNAFPAELLGGSSCLTSDTTMVHIIPKASTEPDLAYCVNSEVTLRGSLPGEGGTGSWAFVSGPSTPTQTFLSSDGQTAIYDNFTGSGDYIFEYTTTSPYCPNSSAQMVVSFADPEPNAGADQLACSSEITLTGSALEGVNDVAEWMIESGSGSIVSGQNSTEVTIGSLIPGDLVTVSYTITRDGTCISSDEVNITVDYVEPLTLTFENPSGCGNSDGILRISGAIANTSYQLYYLQDGVQQGPVSITTDLLGQYELTGMPAGNYSEIYIENSSGCTSDPLGPQFLNDFCTQNLGNYVWIDANSDGQQDTGELGLDGVTVYLYEDIDQDGVPDGPAIDVEVTAGGGYYLFEDLFAGNYVVEFDLSTATGNYGFTFTDAGGDQTDSDADMNGFTETIELLSGTDNLTIDAGVVEGCVDNDCIFINAARN